MSMWQQVYIQERPGKKKTKHILRWRDAFGRDRSRTVGTDKKHAEYERRKLEQEINSSIYHELPTIRLSEFAKQHLELMSGRHRPKTLDEGRRALSGLQAAMGDVLLEEVTPIRIEHWFGQRLQKVKKATANKDRRTLSGAFGHAVKRGYLKENPFSRVSAVREEEKDIRVLTVEEVKALLDAAPNLMWWAIIFTMLTAGLRHGEIVYFEWEDIDWERAILRVRNKPEHPLKTGQIRDQPLPNVTQECLREWRRETGSLRYVFTTSRGTPLKNNFNRKFRRIVEDAKIAYATPHDLRRTFVSYLQMAGNSEALTQKLAGHASAETTRRYYTRMLPPALRAAPNKLPWVTAPEESTGE